MLEGLEDTGRSSLPAPAGGLRLAKKYDHLDVSIRLTYKPAAGLRGGLGDPSPSKRERSDRYRRALRPSGYTAALEGPRMRKYE